jgi:ABC-type glycerol-3-phosphate transport system permease component
MTKAQAMSMVRGLFLLSALVVVAFPLVWVTLASFKTPVQLNDPTLILFSPSLVNWSYVLEAGILAALWWQA